MLASVVLGKKRKHACKFRQNDAVLEVMLRKRECQVTRRWVGGHPGPAWLHQESTSKVHKCCHRARKELFGTGNALKVSGLRVKSQLWGQLETQA